MSAAAFCTARPGGFTASECEAVERIVPALRNVCELRTLRKVELTLLDTDTGKRTAQRILAGRIRRGQIESLEAALMICDLRGFTEMSNRLPSTHVLELLDAYFDRVVPAITEAGGKIVKLASTGHHALKGFCDSVERYRQIDGAGTSSSEPIRNGQAKSPTSVAL